MQIIDFLRAPLFAIDPETAHTLTITALRLLPETRAPKFDSILQSRVAGIDFASPIGLAAGFDKNAQVARAVIGRPDLLVADEPTGNVDPEMAQRLLHLFDGLNRLGTTVVVATHDLHLLSRVGTAQMMRLDRGRLSDPTGALKYPPLSEDT